MRSYLRWIRTTLAAGAALIPLNPASAADRPTHPTLTLSAISVFHRVYLPDSAGLKAALIASKGDREESQITMWVSLYSSLNEFTYFDHYTATAASAYYDLRKAAFFHVTTRVTVDANHPPEQSTSFEPFGFTPEKRSFRCVQLAGNWVQHTEVKSECLLVHKVTRRALVPTLHTWNPVQIRTVFTPTPVTGDCHPVNRKGRTLFHPMSLASGGAQEFDVATAGFSNEYCETPGDWSLSFNQPSGDR